MKPGSIAVLLFFVALSSLTFSSAISAQKSTSRQPQFTEEGTMACLVCHSGEKIQAVQDSEHGNNEQGCESCHGPGSFHVSRAHGGRGFPNMINFGDSLNLAPRQVQLDACLDCHAQSGKAESTIEFTGSPHDVDEITCTSCHTGHIQSDPMLDDMGLQAESCYSCHEESRDNHNPFEGKSIDLSTLSCATCHDVHATPIHN